MRSDLPSRPGPVIEFIGLAGSGKTTLAVELTRLLRGRGIQVHGPLGGEPFGEKATRRGFAAYHAARLWSVVRMLALDPKFLSLSWKALADTGQPSASALSRLAVNWLNKVDKTRSIARQDGIVVFDEGVLHAAWSINYSAAEGRSVPPSLISQAYRGSGGRDWIVIDVEGSADLALTRVEHRHGLRHRMVRQIPELGREGVVRRAEHAVGQVRSALVVWSNERSGVSVARVSSEDGDPRECAESLVERLWEIIDGPTRHRSMTDRSQ